MPKQIEPTLKWEDAPDMITPKHLAKILGICSREAIKKFNSKDFPVLSETSGRKVAYKYDVAEFMGIKLNHRKQVNDDMMNVLQNILAELKKKNEIRASLIKEL